MLKRSNPLHSRGCIHTETTPSEKVILAQLNLNFCGHKLLEMWNGDGGLVEELDLEPLEVRCRDVRKKPLQVSTDTTEHKPAKVRKRNVYRNWHMQDLSLDIVGGNMVEKANPEGLQLG